MREWGWTIPVLIDEQGGIIAGHCRVMAAELNGYSEAPVMIARGWSEAKKRAYVLADNKLAMNAGWNEELLGVELLWNCPGTPDSTCRTIGFNTEELDGSFDAGGGRGRIPGAARGADRAPYQQIDVHAAWTSRIKVVQQAVSESKAEGEFGETMNDNANGNALARICQRYLEYVATKAAVRNRRMNSGAKLYPDKPWPGPLAASPGNGAGDCRPAGY